MIELKITGNSFTEINEQLLDVVKGIGAGQTTISHSAPASFPTPPRSDIPDGKDFMENATPTNPLLGTAPALDVPADKKKRRTKAEVEADKAAKLANAQAEVQAAQASHAPAAPIVIPPMPTTEHVVNIPAEQSMATVHPIQQAAPVVQPPVAPPVNQTGAYNLQTFKANLVAIISGLLSTGKLNSEWIAKTAKETFGGQDIWLWSSNEPKIEELFNCFIEWNLIQKFEG